MKLPKDWPFSIPESEAWKRHKAAGGLDRYYIVWRVKNPHSEGYRRWRITCQPFGEMLPGVYRTRAAAERHAHKLGGPVYEE